MKNVIIIILILLSVLSFGQQRIDDINIKVNQIENNDDLVMSEYDWSEYSNETSCQGWIISVWSKNDKIMKIEESVGLSYGRVQILIYLDNDVPIKIIETEENFEKLSDRLNYYKLEEIFKATIFIFDWENDVSEVFIEGNRFFTEGNCSTLEYEPTIERAKILRK